jgi:uncharacterized membrane protein
MQLTPSLPPQDLNPHPVQTLKDSTRVVRGALFSSTTLYVSIVLIFAGIIHILTVLGWSSWVKNSAYQRLSPALTQNMTTLLRADHPLYAQLSHIDPLTVIAVCPFSTQENGTEIILPKTNIIMSVALHQQGGGVFYALPNSAAVQEMLSLKVLSEEHFMQKATEDFSAQDTFLPTKTKFGFAIARAVVLFPSQREQAEQAVLGLRCTPLKP